MRPPIVRLRPVHYHPFVETGGLTGFRYARVDERVEEPSVYYELRGDRCLARDTEASPVAKGTPAVGAVQGTPSVGAAREPGPAPTTKAAASPCHFYKAALLSPYAEFAWGRYEVVEDELVALPRDGHRATACGGKPCEGEGGGERRLGWRTFKALGREHIELELWDIELNAPCRFQSDWAGLARCYPAASPGPAPAIFRDSGCSKPLFCTSRFRPNRARTVRADPGCSHWGPVARLPEDSLFVQVGRRVSSGQIWIFGRFPTEKCKKLGVAQRSEWLCYEIQRELSSWEFALGFSTEVMAPELVRATWRRRWGSDHPLLQ